MPIYEYRCPACGCEEERLQRLKDPPPLCSHDRCERQGQEMTKLVSRTNFELKGTGWYKDGYS
jgi:putative FmdB family regulatory protein